MLTAEPSVDQASGLRRMVNPRPVRAIAVTGGKGGVGKTNVSVNLGVAMCEIGHKVMLLDADLGLANIDIIYGVHPRYNIGDVLSGEKELKEVIVEGPSGVRVIPAGSGFVNLTRLTDGQKLNLLSEFESFEDDFDYFLIDTGAGISDNVTYFNLAADECIVLVSPEPTSITDAYALIKVLSLEYDTQHFRVLANQVQSAQEGRDLFNKISRVTDRYLDVTLEFIGVVPHDDYLRKAVRKQRAVVQAYPRSRSALAFKNLAQKTDRWPVPCAAGGHLEFFIERLIQSRNATMEVLA